MMYEKNGKEWVKWDKYPKRRHQRVFTLDDGTKLTSAMLVNALDLKRPTANFRLNHYSDPEAVFADVGTQLGHIKPKNLTKSKIHEAEENLSKQLKSRPFWDPMFKLALKSI